MQTAEQKSVYLCTTFDLCDNNGYSSTQIHNFFEQNGYRLTNEPRTADYIIISTCGFDQERERQSRAIVDEHVERYGADKKIIVCGCLTKINPGLFDPSKVTAIGPRELGRFNSLFNPTVAIENISGGELNERFINRGYGFLDAYYLQICQGCINKCSYCAIKKAKGYIASKTLKQVIVEVELALEAGFRRFMLLGDDCGSYGIDLGCDLADLLNAISGYDIGININYIYPGRFQNIFKKLSQNALERLEFANIPIQSTSGRVLDLMNRHYDPDEVLKTIEGLKAALPHAFFETHIIYGFPSEKREEFEDSFRAVDYFDSVIYFYYTDRNNVPSSEFKNKIDVTELIERTASIINHSRFCIQRDQARLPVILLGYDLKKPDDIYKSILNSFSAES